MKLSKWVVILVIVWGVMLNGPSVVHAEVKKADYMNGQRNVIVSLVNFERRTLDGYPTYWIRLKCRNNSLVTFGSTCLTVKDTCNGKNLYALTTIGYMSDNLKSGVSDKKVLNPGEEAYLSVNVGIPVCSKLKVTAEFISVDVDLPLLTEIECDVPDMKEDVALNKKLHDDRRISEEILKRIDVKPLTTSLQTKRGEGINLTFSISGHFDGLTDLRGKRDLGVVYLIQKLVPPSPAQSIPESTLYCTKPQWEEYKVVSNDRRSNSILLDFAKPDISAEVLFRKGSFNYQLGKYRLTVLVGFPYIVKTKATVEFEIVPFPYKKVTIPTVEHEIREVIANQVNQAFYDKDFKFLDALAEGFRNKKERTPCGTFKLRAFYRSIGSISAIEFKDEEYWAYLKERSLEWIKASPNSPTAYIAHGIILENYAWKFRGCSYASKVPQNAWKPFRLNTQIAREFFEKNRNVMGVDPYYYSHMINIMVAQDTDKDEFMYFVNSALDKFPENTEIYYSAVRGLLPKWGGSAKEIAEFANDSAKRTKKFAGMGMYTRIYWYVYTERNFDDFFRDSGVEWDKMLQGMNDEISKYPDPWNLNMFAYFSCIAKQKAAARRFFDMLGDRADMDAWKSRKEFDDFKAWAEK